MAYRQQMSLLQMGANLADASVWWPSSGSSLVFAQTECDAFLQSWCWYTAYPCCRINVSRHQPVGCKVIGLHVTYVSHVRCVQSAVCAALHRGNFKVNGPQTRPSALVWMCQCVSQPKRLSGWPHCCSRALEGFEARFNDVT